MEEFLEEIFSQKNFDALYLGNSKILIREYRKFVETIRLIREKDPNLMIIADLEPIFYSLAVYLGIDAFDTRSLKLYDFRNKGFTQFSPMLWKEEANSLEFAKETIELVRKAHVFYKSRFQEFL